MISGQDRLIFLRKTDDVDHSLVRPNERLVKVFGACDALYKDLGTPGPAGYSTTCVGKDTRLETLRRITMTQKSFYTRLST